MPLLRFRGRTSVLRRARQSALPRTRRIVGSGTALGNRGKRPNKEMPEMKRRDFLKVSATGAAVAAVASPAIAQSSPEIKWRMTSSFPKSLDTLYGGSEYFTKQRAQLTGNTFQIQAVSAGEIVPGSLASDATAKNT